MLIYSEENLDRYKDDSLQMQPGWQERDFVKAVRNYLNCSTEKILAVGGLRGTGKTVGILQAASDYDAVYILVQKGESETGDDYIEFLKNTDKKYVIIDEYSWIQDRGNLDRYLLTAVQKGKRIVITATESITLDFLNYGALNHRVYPVHTTMFTYEEYLRIYNKEHSRNTCREFLTEGGLFRDYVLKNFESARAYIYEAIVKNLAGYLKEEISEEKAMTLTYCVLYKAVCPSNLHSVPTLRKNHVTLDNFLEQMGINTEIIPKEYEINRISEIFEQTGIIVRIPNFNKNSEIKEQYYITNPSLTCQLIKAVYGLSDLENSILGHVFESVVAVQLATNILSEHNIYFYNNGNEQNNSDNKELDIIITDKECDYAYLFECKLKQEPSLKSNATILSGYLEENELKGIEIEGRYVVYNGKPHVREYDVGTIIFTPIGDILDYYFEFEQNLQNITNIDTGEQENLTDVGEEDIEL